MRDLPGLRWDEQKQRYFKVTVQEQQQQHKQQQKQRGQQKQNARRGQPTEQQRQQTGDSSARLPGSGRKSRKRRPQDEATGSREECFAGDGHSRSGKAPTKMKSPATSCFASVVARELGQRNLCQWQLPGSRFSPAHAQADCMKAMLGRLQVTSGGALREAVGLR
ncbi:hypothetical protein CYMTET_20310 [Cymbomonas tetramitiformis]|uniref:Uncharacterized protein n=1 Tax=Cymbomonas tetramitiformis TaxID=36881 RepID=A0AAE0G4F9_9CHLO|nr:hypothetical protein CYMTET_20310 [Cymbomonas tetramitiformis]